MYFWVLENVIREFSIYLVGILCAEYPMTINRDNRFDRAVIYIIVALFHVFIKIPLHWKFIALDELLCWHYFLFINSISHTNYAVGIINSNRARLPSKLPEIINKNVE